MDESVAKAMVAAISRLERYLKWPGGPRGYGTDIAIRDNFATLKITRSEFGGQYVATVRNPYSGLEGVAQTTLAWVAALAASVAFYYDLTQIALDITSKFEMPRGLLEGFLDAGGEILGQRSRGGIWLVAARDGKIIGEARKDDFDGAMAQLELRLATATY